MSKYTLNGQPVPRVSEIVSQEIANEVMDKVGLQGWVHRLGTMGLDYKVARDMAAGIGTWAHEIIAAGLVGRPYRGADGDTLFDLPDPKSCFGSAYGKGSKGGDSLENWTPDTEAFAEARAEYAARKALDWVSQQAEDPRWDFDQAQIERPMVSRLGFGGTPDLVFPELLVDWKTGSSIRLANRVQAGAYSMLVRETMGWEVQACQLVRCGADLDTLGIQAVKTYTPVQVVEMDREELDTMEHVFMALLMAHTCLRGA